MVKHLRKLNEDTIQRMKQHQIHSIFQLDD